MRETCDTHKMFTRLGSPGYTVDFSSNAAERGPTKETGRRAEGGGVSKGGLHGLGFRVRKT